MINKNEQTILKIIKYTPPIFIILLAILFLSLLYAENKNQYEQEKVKLEQDFIASNKKSIKNDIQKAQNYIKKEYELTERKLKINLKKRVDEAHAIATHIYEQNRNKSKKEVTKLIKDALGSIRFNDGRGYFFIYSFDYESILLPIKPSLEGSSFYNFKDGKGRYLTRDIIAQVKKHKEGFQTWWYHKPQDLDNSYKKIGFNKHFEPFDWFIGTGEYVDEFEKTLQQEVLSNIERLTSWNNMYMFIFNFEGDFLLHTREEAVGKNILTLEKANTFQEGITKEALFEKFKTLAQSSGGFLSYKYKKKNGNFVNKTSYVEGFHPWGWIMGKGFYEDDLNATLREMREEVDRRFENHVIKILIFTAVLTLILLGVSSFISGALSKRFAIYKKSIKNSADKNALQQSIMAQQSKMAAMGEMIGNIAHQWKQPLSTITSSASGLSLKYEMDNLTQKEFDTFIDTINISARYLAETIEDFRTFFNPQKEKKTFFIEEVFDKTFKLIDAQFKNRGIEFIKNIEPIEVTTFDNELIQVLINIFNNAKEQLSSLHTKRYVFIDVFKQDKQTVILIKDNGEGINEDIINKVFDPYFTTKKLKDGTGIGLYMSKEIITRRLKGTIKVSNVAFEYENQSFKGAQFKIVLPTNT